MRLFLSGFSAIFFVIIFFIFLVNILIFLIPFIILIAVIFWVIRLFNRKKAKKDYIDVKYKIK